MKFNEKSNLFALERDKGLESIINNVYQSFDGQDVYVSIEEKEIIIDLIMNFLND